MTEAIQGASDNSQVHFVFDRQTDLAPYAVTLFRDTTLLGDLASLDVSKISSVTFENRIENPELQAADLLTHIWYSYYVRGDRLSEERARALDTLSIKKNGIRTFDATGLEVLLSRLPTAVRDDLRRKR